MSQTTNNDTTADLDTTDDTQELLQKIEEIPSDTISAESKQELLQKIRAKVDEIRNYVPKVGVFGDTGAGKSSLCNALFGQDAAKVNDVEACTRDPQEILLQSKNGRMILVDVPGTAEDPKHQKKYTALYMSLASELDLILWAIKADDRKYASAIEAFHAVYPKDKPQEPPVLFVITQTDKTNPTDGWDREAFKPKPDPDPDGKQLLGNIAIKERDVSKKFDLKGGQIISVATSPKGKAYNLTELVDLVVEALPDDKKFSFIREAKQKHVSAKAKKKAKNGFWASIWGFVKEVGKVVGPVVIKMVGDIFTKK
ncbi:MAG: 50S ribosome-binding GTPase [Zoogloeaceae bacterium]|jgi:small GTP-binding protein|nr:50S ribosome-binding GTPase [Zoogloeaceae bacterium]